MQVFFEINLKFFIKAFDTSKFYVGIWRYNVFNFNISKAAASHLCIPDETQTIIFSSAFLLSPTHTDITPQGTYKYPYGTSLHK